MEFVYDVREENSSGDTSTKKTSPFVIVNNEIYSKFIGIRNSSDSKQKLEFDRISQAKIKIIVIDKDTIQYFSNKFNEQFPFPRRRYAELLEKLDPLKPKVVGFDMKFETPSSVKKNDYLFSEAIKRYKHVVVASETTFKKDLERMSKYHLQVGSKEEEIYQETLPVPIIIPSNLLNEHTGYATDPVEDNNSILFAQPWFNMRKLKFMPRLSLPFQIYRHAVDVPWNEIKFDITRLVIGSNVIPLSQKGNIRIYFRSCQVN